MVKRGRSIRKQCKKTSNGKHVPETVERQGIVFKKYVVVCKKCGKRIGRWN